MKKLSFLTILLALFISSCKKDKLSKEEIQSKKIADIIPAKYLDTLKHLGITIHEGTTPPNIEGIYEFKPVKSKASNISSDVIGSFFANAKVKFFSQSNEDFGIQLIAKNLLNFNDTSIITAVSGSGDNFTVYGRVKSSAGNDNAIFAIILTGEKNGTSLKNVEWGLINVDNTNGGISFILEGQARLMYDIDFESLAISSLRLSSDNSPKNIKSPGAR